MNTDEDYMMRCFDLARKGMGEAEPNPYVGCVIVKNNNILSEGYHMKYGEAHAEVNAIHHANPESLSGASLYVNLEPCSHTGKTPPCADLIIKTGIRRVVISSQDPNPLVAGRGIEKLRQAGIEVITGLLEREHEEFNRHFFCFHRKKRPYVLLKWAQTRDGFIDKLRRDDSPQINWITDDACKILVHKWRTECQAILVGTRTTEKDNPQLTTRLWKGKNPLRVVIDKKLVLKHELSVFNGEAPTLIISEKDGAGLDKVEYFTPDFGTNILPSLFDELFRRNIQTLLVEGGADTIQRFIDGGFWDEAAVFAGDICFSEGIPGPRLTGIPVSEKKIGNSTVKFYRNQ